MKVVVDFDKCDSHGLCTESAPEVFQLDDDGTLHVLSERPEQALHAKVREAALVCPTRAITIEEE